MKLSISDLAYAGFRYHDFCGLPRTCGLEFFYEFGTPAYWDTVLPLMLEDRQNGVSVHGPCVQVNLAVDENVRFLEVFLDTFRYAQKIGAEFVVVHTNEALPEEDSFVLRQRVVQKLVLLLQLGKEMGVTPVIENVGLRPSSSLLFDREQFLELPQIFPEAGFLLDVGHAHVNGWDLAATVRTLGHRLKGCHLHDNDGTGDQHQYLGNGTIQWAPFFEALKEKAPEARLVLEYAKLPPEGMAKHVEKVRKEYEI